MDAKHLPSLADCRTRDDIAERLRMWLENRSAETLARVRADLIATGATPIDADAQIEYFLSAQADCIGNTIHSLRAFLHGL